VWQSNINEAYLTAMAAIELLQAEPVPEPNEPETPNDDEQVTDNEDPA
jgi:hypothetical protein